MGEGDQCPGGTEKEGGHTVCVFMSGNFLMVLIKNVEKQELHLCHVFQGLTGGFMEVDPLNKFACWCTYTVSVFFI